MLKRLSAVLFVSALAASACAAAPKRFGFDAGISTGIPIYGGGDVEAADSAVNGGSVNRIVIGGNAGATLRLGAPLKLLAGADLLCDFVWSGGDHSNHLDYAFFGGVKIYPGIRGLAFSIAYALGRRTDFIDNETESATRSTAWGNGFRLSAEYDFLYNS
ncbi:MAG: hypothetical protein K2H09_04070, partial [Treponemataceae bacterium]|nr:hypothetical protein [Treponemataceae bacterium]